MAERGRIMIGERLFEIKEEMNESSYTNETPNRPFNTLSSEKK